MEEERISQMLQELPRERALVGFTARVLRRLDDEAARPRALPVSGPRPLAAAARTARTAREAARLAGRQRWQRLERWSAAAASLATLALAVVVLQREPAQAPVRSTAVSPARAVQPARMATPSLADNASGAARMQALVMAGGGAPVATAQTASLATSQVRQEVRELRLEQMRLQRELHRLHAPADRNRLQQPSVVYLGGDENVDLVLNTGRVRQLQPSPIEHNPDDNNFMD